MPFRLSSLCALLLACGGRTYINPPRSAEVEVTPGRATLTWEDADNAVVTLIVRSIGTEEPTQPTGAGVVGDALGETGVILARLDPGVERFIDNRLPENCGPFAWHLWSRAKDGTWSPGPLTVRSVRGEHTLAPTVPITDLVWANEGEYVRLAWTPPEAHTGFVAATLTRKPGGVPARSNDGTIVYTGPSTSASERRVHLSTTEPNHYAIFNCNLCGKCGAEAPSVVVVPGSGPSLDITGFDAGLSEDGTSVSLTWTSTSPDVRIVRALNQVPSGAFDTGAQLVFADAGTLGVALEPLSALLPQVSPVTPMKYTWRAFACAGGVCGAEAPTAELSVTLRQALVGGGYALFFHHATANVGVDQTDAGVASQWWKSCDEALARQLGPAAASDAEIDNVRAFFATSGVQVSELYASEFCRARQTAEGFGLAAPAIGLPSLNLHVYPEAMRCGDALSSLNAQPAAGTNIVYVGHAQYQQPCPNLDGLVPGQAAIYKPQLGAPTRFVGHVNSAGWAQLP